MVNLLFFFTFDHFSYQNGCIFPYLEKTPVHQVILYTAIKKLKEELLACGKPNTTVTDKKKSLIKELINKLLL